MGKRGRVFLVIFVLSLIASLIALSVLYAQERQTHAANTAQLEARMSTLPDDVEKLKAFLVSCQDQSARKSEEMSSMKEFAQISLLANPFEKFDRIYYINLDSRPDRKYEIERELLKMKVSMDRVQRMPGVLAKFGALGCSRAHEAILKDCKAHGYANCLVLEDDFVFKQNPENTYKALNKFWTLGMNWDVLLFASNTMRAVATDVDFVAKILDAQTTAGYAVNGKYVDTLLRNVSTGIQSLEQQPKTEPQFCIDIFWKSLQPKDNWYALSPSIGTQRESFSDIENRVVAYGEGQTFETVAKEYEYIIAVKCCAPRLFKNKDQLASLKKLSEQHKILYFYYYGNPKQKEEYIWDTELHVVTLRCQDDYLSLCHKFGEIVQFLKMLTTTANSCRNIKGVFFTDDDIRLDDQKLYAYLEERCTIPYWGNGSNVGNDVLVYHIQYKCKASSFIANHVRREYPQLENTPVKVEPHVLFASGGGFYLDLPTLLLLSTVRENFMPLPSREHLRYHEKVTSDGTRYYENLHLFDDMEVGIVLKKMGILLQHEDVIHQVAFW